MKLNNGKINEISVPAIRRLPLYLSFLRLILNNQKNISAPEIARALHVDPTQVSKDFSNLEINGKTKVGYDVISLIDVMENFLGYHISRKAFIIGAGNLGISLIKYNEFHKEGIDIVAAFDIDSQVIGSEINGKHVFDLFELKDKASCWNIDIGIIAVPPNQAQKIADLIVDNGIKAIWNFSNTPISAPDNIIIENTSIDSSLAMIKWKLNRNKSIIYKNRIL